jgi:hypothetical protein
LDFCKKGRCHGTCKGEESVKRIQDGFLAPYKVVRLNLDKDLGWRPTEGQTDRHGNLIPDREYNVIDMDNELILRKRTIEVAKKVTTYLKATNPYNKSSTISLHFFVRLSRYVLPVLMVILLSVSSNLVSTMSIVSP